MATLREAVFEWYYFYIYGTLAPILAKEFFSGVNPTTGFHLNLARLRRRLCSASVPCPAFVSTAGGTPMHLLASGVHPKVASERLGHSKVGITLDTYSHVLPNMQADVAALVDGALAAAVKKRGAERIG